MTPREVQVWFQNRRAKSKRLEKKAQQQAEAANKAGTAPGGNDPTQQGPGSAPTVSEHPKLSDRQRSEQQYFEALAKAQQQSSVGPDVHLPPANVVHREWYPPQSALGTASEATMPPPHYMQQRRMTMPANANYNGNDSVPPAYGAGPWTSHDQHIHTGQSAHPSHPYDCPDEHAGQQPFLARLQIPQNDDQIPATPSSTASNNHLYANFRSPLDPFSPAEPPQLEGHSPGMEPATGYFPQAGEAPSSAFGTAENPYMISRRQHSSGSISSNGDSSLGYSTTGTGAMTPTSCLSFSTAASTPVEYLPPGFDANSRRASCPAEFIASFDSMSMPSSAYTGIYASQGQGLAMPPQYANMSPQDNLPQPHLLSPRRHSIATGAAASAPEDLSLFNAASTALSRSPAYIQRTMTPSQLDPIAEAPAVVHQPRPVSAHQAPTFLHQDAAEPDAVEELKSDKELTSPSDAPGSPPRKGQGVQPRKSRSSSSMKSICQCLFSPDPP